MFAGNFPPRGWATCDGQLLSISQNTALFSLLGTQYGGDGRTNFALPDLRDSTPMHQGQGPGLSPHFIGESGGQATVTLLSTEMPVHTHDLKALSDPAESSAPAGKSLARASGLIPYSASAPNTAMHPSALSQTGGGQPHNNRPPYQTINFIIALQGIYPPRG